MCRHGACGAQEAHVRGHLGGDVLVCRGDDTWRNGLLCAGLGQAADDYVLPHPPALLLLVVGCVFVSWMDDGLCVFEMIDDDEEWTLYWIGVADLCLVDD